MPASASTLRRRTIGRREIFIFAYSRENGALSISWISISRNRTWENFPNTLEIELSLCVCRAREDILHYVYDYKFAAAALTTKPNKKKFRRFPYD